MKLGILVNSAKHLEHVVGICRAASSKNHQVILFAMDRGTELLQREEFAALARLEGVSLAICDHSAKVRGVNTDNLASNIVCGSQLNNAMMVHDADRVIVL